MAPPRMVYVAYPIDQVANRLNSETAKMYGRLEDAKIALLVGGVDIAFDPGDAFKIRLGAEGGPEVREINRAALNAADAVIAMMPKDMPSVGVPMEIDFAVSMGKAVAVLTDVDAWMLQFSPYTDAATFLLDEEGFEAAVTWLLAHERGRSEDREYEPLPFVVLDKDATVDLTPHRTYEDDAGWDLVTSRDTTVGPTATVDVPCGIAVQLPSWAYGRITGRSSTMRRRGLLVGEGIIDTGFRGELFVQVTNLGGVEKVIKAGDRVGQFILHTNDSAAVRPIQVQDLLASQRGTNGFGSTGQ